MKTINKYLVLGAVTAFQVPLVMHGAFGFACMGEMCSSDDDSFPVNFINACSSYSDTCYSGSRVRSCDTCQSGFTRTQQSTTVSGCSGSVSFYTCLSSGGSGGDVCDGTCTDCVSTDWTDSGTGRQIKTTATCNKSTCKCTKKTDYRCKAGYYGQAMMVGGCTACPGVGTSAVGSTSITDCYVTGGHDSTGTFKYTSNCYYSE